jgi:peptidoglycan/LPS O-acetylase OafA/YrhL
MSGAVRFKGLNALRFFAAYLVLHHGERMRAKYGSSNFKQYDIFNNGRIAVTFFFVLSGFLITHLLLYEKRSLGRIDIPKFYVRRSLRIWPLYFLLVGLGLYAVPLATRFAGIPYQLPYTTS